MTSKLVQVRLDLIDPNPYRHLKRYPFVQSKLDSLQRSIEDVGFWEGVIARKVGRRHQLAFGHHRFEAARRSKLKSIPLVVRDLSDERMIEMMGRENLEDYNADFPCMLESWQAAREFRAHEFDDLDNIMIARTLGWTTVSGKGRNKAERMNNTAKACSAADSLIEGGYLKRKELDGLAVRSALDICTRAQTRVKQLDALAAKGHRTRSDVERAKKRVGKAAETTAKEVRKGHVTHTEVAGRVDYNVAGVRRTKPSPLFAKFGDSTATAIGRMLDEDAIAKRLGQIIAVKKEITLADDRRAVRNIDRELEKLEKRIARWRKRLQPAAAKSLNGNGARASVRGVA
jgi:hypothetical protein